ncbi:hypothetical protein RRG08_053785 [Elysia crispata]|uniref:Uncharacterized protein n=1 Tax=Elysia crispata TaxID=231223 RepID=A0AAE0ZBE2_9GAST|nr:hypothetical protein RRG08_053785 [Elysia crispata]
MIATCSTFLATSPPTVGFYYSRDGPGDDLGNEATSQLEQPHHRDFPCEVLHQYWYCLLTRVTWSCLSIHLVGEEDKGKSTLEFID